MYTEKQICLFGECNSCDCAHTCLSLCNLNVYCGYEWWAVAEHSLAP